MQRPRGTRDLYGDELTLIRRVQNVLEDVFHRYGYGEIETPIFEHLDLFTQKSGSEIKDQIYHFEDKSNRELALRPELTAPSIRFYNNELKSKPKPLKIFYFGHCFRYERPQSGRWRQFLQAGVELIGTDRPEADAEVIALSKDSMDELELDNYDLRIGQIGILRRILEHGGVSSGEQDPVLRAIDSEEDERIREEMERSGLDESSREKVWELIDLTGGPETLEDARDLLRGVPDTEKPLENFRNILSRLEEMEVEEYLVDWGIARGLEYYTGSVFELYVDDVQIGGGGRYDDLIESLGGEPTPAVGVGLGVDRIAQSLESQEKSKKPVLDAMLLPTEDAMLEESLRMVRELRKAGFRIDVDLMGRSLGKGLSYADSRGAKYAIIVGPDDVSEGRVTIKDMESGEQERIFQESVPKRLES